MRYHIFLFSLFGLFWLTACNLMPTPEPYELGGAVVNNPQPAPDFTLMSADGPVRLSDFAGKYVYIYFGYTFCPDVCPATMNELAELEKLLGDDADQIQVIMITVDPARDTPQRLAEYMAFFSNTFIGLSGTDEEIAAAAQPYGVFYEAHEGTAESGYLVDHSTRTYLLNPNREPIVAYPFDVKAAIMAADLAHLRSR